MAIHPDGYYYYRINNEIFSFPSEVEKHKGKEVSPDEEPFKTQWANWGAQAYARKRQAEFPSVGDQLDMQYHDQLNGTTTWKDAIAKVKADNPKENE
tara:strand:- start:228 stop:518 length:291 start_codon:yes stop_codon:yes gene_type:complete